MPQGGRDRPCWHCGDAEGCPSGCCLGLEGSPPAGTSVRALGPLLPVVPDPSSSAHSILPPSLPLLSFLS